MEKHTFQCQLHIQPRALSALCRIFKQDTLYIHKHEITLLRMLLYLPELVLIDRHPPRMLIEQYVRYILLRCYEA